MNYREKLRKAVECPQFGNINYGEYGALRLDQRKNIKRLLDEMDRADEVIKHQFFEIERLNNIINEFDKWLKEKKEQMEEFELYKRKETGAFWYSTMGNIETFIEKIKELKGVDKE